MTPAKTPGVISLERMLLTQFAVLRQEPEVSFGSIHALFTQTLLSLVLCCATSGSAHSAITQLDFAAHAFSPASPAAPQSSVIGRLVWNAQSPTSQVGTLLDIDLVIDGFSWSLADVGVIDEPTQTIVGGTVTGVNSVDGAVGVPDFFLFWDRSTYSPIGFAFATKDCCTAWTTSAFQSFSVQTVDAPPTMYLALTPLLYLLVVAGRRHLTEASPRSVDGYA